MTAIVWQNQELERIVPPGHFGSSDVSAIEEALDRHGTLTMRPLSTGLFSAAAVGSAPATSGYGNVWVRDNVYVAYAHFVRGKVPIAARTTRALMEFFRKPTSRRRFEAIIAHEVDPGEVMARPHIRFDGENLEEIPQRWSHAQNDALGYALWLYARLAAAGVVELDEPSVRTLALLPRYFEAIRFWQDEDSGHWEEIRRRSASSIGTVVAGLEALLALARAGGKGLRASGFSARAVDLTADLAMRGRQALDEILPSECAQASPQQNRRYDAALLFLIHPLEILVPPRSDLVLHDIERFLSGSYGVRRYLGDSYWAPDYDERLSPEDQTRDFSEDMADRDELLERIGDEAQWCIFDPILSAHYGARYLATASVDDQRRQEHHLRRALAQISASWQCPELYYRKRGQYVPNPHTPLHWAQANLMIALAGMAKSVRAAP